MLIYRLKNTKPISWQVPLKGLTLEKTEEINGVLVSKGKRRIKYVKGTNSIFEEDIKGDFQPMQIWFENGELKVPESDLLLIEIMQRHPLNNKAWYLWSEDKEIEDNLKKERAKDSVIQLITDSDDDKIKAVATAIFGYSAISWNVSKSEFELRKYAREKPLNIEKELKSENYQSKYLAALAFNKMIVGINLDKTAVIWNDTTKGVILPIPKGGTGLNVLSDFLSVNTAESVLVLQTISEKIQKLETTTPVETKTQDNELEKLKEENKLLLQKLEELQKNDQEELDVLRELYKEKFQKEVPPRYKNDKAWLNKKIEEKTEEQS